MIKIEGFNKDELTNNLIVAIENKDIKIISNSNFIIDEDFQICYIKDYQFFDSPFSISIIKKDYINYLDNKNIDNILMLNFIYDIDNALYYIKESKYILKLQKRGDYYQIKQVLTNNMYEEEN